MFGIFKRKRPADHEDADELDQWQIAQEAVSFILENVESGWIELAVSYHVDDSQSELCGSYLINRSGTMTEKAITRFDGADAALRKLRLHLSQGGKAPFSSCQLRIKASDGACNISYGYEPIDWVALVTDSSWNFPVQQKETSW